MRSLYKKIILLALQTACLPVLHGQNLPDLSQAAPAGSSAVTLLPPALSGTAVPTYIRTYSPRVPMVQEPYINTVTPEEVSVVTAYKDGFNTTMMSVAHNATLNGTTLMHLVQPVDTRFRRDGQGFPGYASSSAAYSPNMFTAQSDYYNALYPNENYAASSKVQVLSTATQRGVKSLAAGKSQVGQNRGITTIKTTNTASQVRIWEPNSPGSLPSSTAFYPAGELFGEKTWDTTGAETTTYTDKDGKVISKTVKQESVVSGGTVTVVYGTTLYLYDDYGRLRYTFPPLAYNLSIGGSITQARLDSLCFQYQYDTRGRLSAQRKPGEWGFTSFVYDKKDRPVMRQTPNEAITGGGQWEVTFYDMQGRVKATSLYTNSNNRDYWQNLIDNGPAGATAAELSWHLMTAAGEAAYPAENAVSGNTLMSYAYYDDYSRSDPGDSKWGTYGSQLMFEPLTTAEAEAPARSNRTHGMATGGKVRILPAPGISTAQTGAWTEQASFYDDKGRNIYTVSYDMDQSNLVHAHYTGLQYDFMGRVLLSKHKMINNVTGTADAHKEYNRNYYHPQTGQLTQTTHRSDDGLWTTGSLYTYDALGRVQRKVLGNYGEVQDYSYNIRGQLTGINAVYAETGNKAGESRSFGESLRYDYGFSQPRYDGKVAGMVWRGSNTSDKYAYGYSYDYGGRLKSADFRRMLGAALWENQGMDYTVSNLQYDRNGNILNMNQRGPGTSTPVTMDQLSYTYKGNQLTRVEDAQTVNYGDGDFQNGNSGTDDYKYDANGNLATDANKGILSVTYTHFNKPQVITLAGGKTIANSYDASGNKVEEKVTDPGKPTIVRDYAGNYVYENNVLQYLLTAEGRSVYDKNTNTFKDEYFVKDHLGNIRSVVDVHNYPIQQYLASYEIASANLENLFFDNVDEVRDDRPGATWNGDLKSARLNGADPDRRTGTSLLLKVMAGDKIELNVNNYYNQYDKDDDQPVNLEDMLGSVVSTLAGGQGGSLPGEGHDTKLVNNVLTMPNYQAFDQMVNATTDQGKPKAYLNYLMFNERMELVPELSGAFQANGNGTWTQMGTTAPLVVPANGYLAVYLNNRSQLSCGSCGDVFFDQLVVRVSYGVLKEESHYMPFGLPMAGMGSTAAGFEPNRRKYQSNEYITDIGLNWMDFQNRQYDPQIGRFLSVDPLAEATDMMGPYVAMNNDPVLNVDPLGLQASMENAMLSESPHNSILSGSMTMNSPTLQNLGAKAKSWGEGFMETILMEVTSKTSKNQDEIVNGGGNTIFGYRVLFIYESETPEIYANTVKVLQANPDLVLLTYNGDLIAKKDNRKRALSGKGDPGSGRSWDEFPYAMTKEGGTGAYVFAVPTKEQQIQAGQLGALVTKGGRMKAGEKFFVVPIKDQRTKQPAPVPLLRDKPSNFPIFPVFPFLRRLVPAPVIIPSIMPFINPNYEPQGESYKA